MSRHDAVAITVRPSSTSRSLQAEPNISYRNHQPQSSGLTFARLDVTRPTSETIHGIDAVRVKIQGMVPNLYRLTGQFYLLSQRCFLSSESPAPSHHARSTRTVSNLNDTNICIQKLFFALLHRRLSRQGASFGCNLRQTVQISRLEKCIYSSKRRRLSACADRH